MIYCKSFKSFFILYFICQLLLPFVSASQGELRQVPMASISTTSASVVLVGSTVELVGSVVSPSFDEGNFFSRWRFAKKPFSSQAFFSTPAPSMPSFIVDQEGSYVIELVVGDKDFASEPIYYSIAAVNAAGDVALSSQTVMTPQLCAMSLGLLGCGQVSQSFSATAGDYHLNMANHSVTDIAMTLNSKELVIPTSFGPEVKLSIPVLLEDQK